MKASVITLHTINNYGSALQTYATRIVLEKMGVEPEFVDYWRANNTPEQRALNLLNSKPLQRIKPIWSINTQAKKITLFLLRKLYVDKEREMRRFVKQNVRLSERRYYSLESIRENLPLADVYITGSDQVWNSTWNQGIDRVFFLDYAPPGKPKIAFAASIGKTKFEEDEIEETKSLLQQYKAISVREESAVKLLSSIGIDSTLILDPTLMLTSDEWRRIETTRIKIQKPYLLIYQLHPNDMIDKYATDLAKRKGLSVIRIGYSRSDKNKVGKGYIGIPVTEFIGLFDRAECVLTDSFHATAFSLNLGVDFISVLPKQFGTRIENITNITGTENRVLKSYSDYNIYDEKIDKDNVKRILDQKRKAGYEFLERAINK